MSDFDLLSYLVVFGLIAYYFGWKLPAERDQLSDAREARDLAWRAELDQREKEAHRDALITALDGALYELGLSGKRIDSLVDNVSSSLEKADTHPNVELVYDLALGALEKESLSERTIQRARHKLDSALRDAELDWLRRDR